MKYYQSVVGGLIVFVINFSNAYNLIKGANNGDATVSRE
jgi:hypothetical protein